MRTNSKEVREQIRKHILDCVCDAEENYYSNIDDAAQRLTDEFRRVADHPYNLKKLPVNQERFSDYLNGLPFSFHYSFYDIAQYLNSLGINPTNKKYDDNRSTRLYHYLIWREVSHKYYSK